MKRKPNRILIVFAVLLFGALSPAKAFAAGEWSDWFTITEIRTSKSTTGYINVKGVTNSSQSCTSSTEFQVLDTETQYKDKVALLTAAFLGRKEVSIYLNGCGSGYYPQLKGVMARD